MLIISHFGIVHLGLQQVCHRFFDGNEILLDERVYEGKQSPNIKEGETTDNKNDIT